MSEQFPGSSHESAEKQPLRRVELTKAEWQALHMSADPNSDPGAKVVMDMHHLSFDEGDLDISVYDVDNDERQNFIATTDSADPFTRRRVDSEAVAPVSEPNEYDNLYRMDVDLDESNGYSVENAAVVTPESEKNLELKTEYSVARLEAAARADPQLMLVIQAALKDLPKDGRSLVEALHGSDEAAKYVTDYFRDKAEVYRASLPNRVQENGPKKPGFPGGKVKNSLDVVADYAWRKVAGYWDPSREDGATDEKATVGQHREAADRMLFSPSIAWEPHRER